MKFVEKVKSVIHKYYIKRVLRRIRKSFSLFGYPLEDVSDEEITKAIEDVVKAASAVGFTATQASEAFRLLAKQFTEPGEKSRG